MPLFILNFISWIVVKAKAAIAWFVENWRLALCVIGAVVVIGLFGFVMQKACGVKPKIDIETVNDINNANESDRKKMLEKTITENASVVKTVDERNTIAEVSEAEKQAQIYVKIQEVDAKITAAKDQGRDVTGPELECLLTGACK